MSCAARITIGLALLSSMAADLPDHSTPKKSAIAFAGALEEDDPAKLKATCVGTPDQFKLIERLAHLVNAARKLHEAAVARFGEAEARKIILSPAAGDDFAPARALQESEERIEGDAAILFGPQDKAALKLKRIRGAWYVDLAALPDREQLARAMPLLGRFQKSLLTGAEQIKAGKYKTADEARQELERALAADAQSAHVQ